MNLTDFYAENPRRQHSGESDYGVWWIDGPDFPRYRVSYIQATGEVYAVNHSTQEVEVLGVAPPDSQEPLSGRERVVYYDTLDRILDGWAEARDLSWMRERMATVRA